MPGQGQGDLKNVPGMVCSLRPCYANLTTEFAERAKGGKTPAMQLLTIDLSNSSPEEDVPPAVAAAASTAVAAFKQHSRQFGEDVSSEEAAKIAAAQSKSDKTIDLYGSDGGGKQPAAAAKRSGRQRIPAPADWPFTKPADFPFTNPKKQYWKRMQKRNELSKRMDVNKDELSERGKRERKRAKKTPKSMQRNEGNYETIVESILATNGITSSQVSAYEKKRVKNRTGKNHSSQDDVRMYRNGHETESDDE